MRERGLCQVDVLKGLVGYQGPEWKLHCGMLADGDRGQVALPLPVGSFVDGRWRNGEFHNAKIIEIRASTSDVHDYYLHYLGCAPLPHIETLKHPNCITKLRLLRYIGITLCAS